MLVWILSYTYGHKLTDNAGLPNCFDYLFLTNSRTRYIISLPNFYTAGIVPNNVGSIVFILLAIGRYLLRLPFFRDYPALTQ